MLPEMWTTSFNGRPSDELLKASAEAEDAIVRLSSELDMIIVGGGPVADEGKVFNRALVAENGEVTGDYRKVHLFSPNAEHRYHDAGHEPLIVDTDIGRIGVVICYDIRFPELIRYYFYRNVEILCVPSQWPEARADHWRILAKARAIENEMFVVGCNRTGSETSQKNGEEALVFPGDSRIVDPMGKVVSAGSGESEPLIGELEMRRVRTMRRILPVAKDRRPQVYSELWNDVWSTLDQPDEAPQS